MILHGPDGLRFIVTRRADGVLEIILDTSTMAWRASSLVVYLNGKKLVVP